MGIRKSAKRLIKLAKKNPNLYTREDVIYAKLIKKQQDERKISEVTKLQKKVKVDLALKLKEKKLKKKAKSLNELVKGVERKKHKKRVIRKGKIQFPDRGEIISNYGEGKDLRKSKNGLVFRVNKDSFVTSPINGMVVFANQFRTYGNLVIIENDEGFYCV